MVIRQNCCVLLIPMTDCLTSSFHQDWSRYKKDIFPTQTSSIKNEPDNPVQSNRKEVLDPG